MKLVLDSGGFSRENQALAGEVADMLRKKRSPVVAFVPTCSENWLPCLLMALSFSQQAQMFRSIASAKFSPRTADPPFISKV